MTAEEYGEFMARILPVYVAERANADRVSPLEADHFVREQLLQLLPRGRETIGHDFLRIIRVGTSEWLGGVWASTDLVAKTAFLYNITVFPNFRRRGVAREAVSLLQDRVSALGCATLALNVFATNIAAMSLYKTMGFEVVSSHMNKAL